MPVISASFESFVFLSVFKLTNLTCSSSNSVDLIKSFIFIFIERKIKGVVRLFFIFIELKVIFFFFFLRIKSWQEIQIHKTRPC